MQDRRCTAWSVAITAVAAVAAVLYCVLAYPALNPGRTWFVPNDAPQLINAGSALIHGHLQQVYSGDRELYALPLSFPYAGLISMIISWRNLIHINPPWWVMIALPLFIAPGALVLQQTRRLAWDLGLRRRLWLTQLLAGVLVFVPLIEWGHPEDILALACVLLAVRRVIRNDMLRACLWLSAAIGFKQWAVMLVPLFVLATPAGQRVRSLVAACALPAALASLFLAVDFHAALSAFLSPVTQVSGFPGHPWIDGTWLGSHSSQVNRIAATGLACVVAWRRRRRMTHPEDIVVAIALVLIIRPLTETINYSYYWSPSLLLLTILLVSRRDAPRFSDWVWPVAAIAWTFPRSNDLTALDWWVGEALLLAVTAWRIVQTTQPRARTGDLGPWLPRPQPVEVAG